MTLVILTNQIVFKLPTQKQFRQFLQAMTQINHLIVAKNPNIILEDRIMNPLVHGINSVMKFMKKLSSVKDTHTSIIRYQLSLLSKVGVWLKHS